MAWSRGTTRVASRAASSPSGRSDATASCTTGSVSMLRAATSGSPAAAGSCTRDTACWISASFAAMSVPNSYSTVMMLRWSLEKDSNCFTSPVVLMACSSGVVTLVSTVDAEAPWSTVTTVR